MKTSKLFVLSILTSVGLIFNSSPSFANTFVESKVAGDDQFKIYLSATPPTSMTPPKPEGIQYANGLGWAHVFTNTMYIPLPAQPTNQYYYYWINIWVRDEGGGGPSLLGQFQITGAPASGNPSFASNGGCKFDNGTTNLVTNTQNWKVTKPLNLSTQPLSPVGYPSFFNNYLPPFIAPTLAPLSLGANGVPPWGLRTGGLPTAISSSAEWLTTNPAYSNYKEAWFSTRITCFY
jgi:hypothetical protein